MTKRKPSCCPYCGTVLVTKSFEERERRFCPTYQEYIFQNPVPVARVIILDGDSALFVRRAQLLYQGAWTISGGVLEVNESAALGATRELQEETLVRASAEDLEPIYTDLNVDDPNDGSILTICFAVESDRTTGTPQIGDEGETDGGIEPTEESVETSLEVFGADVDHRERDSRIDRPEASTFGVDDRPEVTSTAAGEQGALFADTDADQRTLTGERAADRCLSSPPTHRTTSLPRAPTARPRRPPTSDEQRRRAPMTDERDDARCGTRDCGGVATHTATMRFRGRRPARPRQYPCATNAPPIASSADFDSGLAALVEPAMESVSS